VANFAYQVSNHAYQGAGVFAYQGTAGTTGPTLGATNYMRPLKRRRLPNSEPSYDAAELNRIFSRALADEQRLRREKRLAELELAAATVAHEGQSPAAPRPHRTVRPRNAPPPDSGYQKAVRDRISHYETQIRELKDAELALRLKVLHEERIAARDLEDILMILMLDEISGDSYAS
jgi:hypothetical protein